MKNKSDEKSGFDKKSGLDKNSRLEILEEIVKVNCENFVRSKL